MVAEHQFDLSCSGLRDGILKPPYSRFRLLSVITIVASPTTPRMRRP